MCVLHICICIYSTTEFSLQTGGRMRDNAYVVIYICTYICICIYSTTRFSLYLDCYQILSMLSPIHKSYFYFLKTYICTLPKCYLYLYYHRALSPTGVPITERLFGRVSGSWTHLKASVSL